MKKENNNGKVQPSIQLELHEQALKEPNVKKLKSTSMNLMNKMTNFEFPKTKIFFV